jgi:putative tricarboxylic transport membrane protein
MSRTTTARRSSLSRTAAVLSTVALVTTACGTTAGNDEQDTAASGPVTGLRVMVPNSPGSGYDQTARAATKAMEDGDLAKTVEVFNVAGAGGTVGLQRLVNEKGNADLLMQMGLGVVGAEFTNKSEATLAETTPIAGLIEEAEVIVVPKDSPYDDLAALTEAWKADPGKLPVGGASNPGGPDHLTPMLLAEEVGVDPKTVNYVPYDGGGELLAGILGKKLAFAATGISEVAEQAKAGDLTILAVTSDEPVEGVDAPTLKEEGIDLTFTNWRGIVAAPGISEADRTKLIDLVTEMHESPEWQEALETNGWTDAFLAGDDFEEFLTTESERVQGVLSGLGLA